MDALALAADRLDAPDLAAQARTYWRQHGRPEQHTPGGAWNVWLILAGRGFGKTRTGAEDIADYMTAHPGHRIAVVAPTFTDARDTCIEGESGLLAVLERYGYAEGQLTWNRSLGELILPNGARAKLFSAEKPARLRGPQHHRAWCLAAGSMVTTAAGDVPIEDVTVGTLVSTTRGLRRVLATSERKAQLCRVTLADGRELVGSVDHPIATIGGWKPLGNLASTDRIWAWRDDGGPRLTGTSAGTKTAGRFTSTAKCGNSTTGRSAGSSTCTTSTMTRPTTGSRTCRSQPLASTGTLTRKPAPTRAPSAAAATSPRSTTTERPTAVTADGRQPNAAASSSSESAESAVLSSRPGLETIAVSGASTLAAVGSVYNLAVDEVHEFFANGVLTHNCDELAQVVKDAPDAWDQLLFGLRLGKHPQVVATTTPLPVKLVRELIARASEDVHLTRGSTYDNAANLAGTALAELKTRYEGTRLGRQELFAELLDDLPGALWQRSWLDDDRTRRAPECTRVVVGVDPAVTSGESADETGIIVAGQGVDGDFYVLADRSVRTTPLDWAGRAVAAYQDFDATEVVIETNQGGEALATLLRQIEPTLPIREVHAKKGKRVRAEPVSALYEQHRVHHVGDLDTLEDQLCNWVPEQVESPDRMDALVYALLQLSQPSSAMAFLTTLAGR